MSNRTKLEKALISLELDELETPVAPVHPAFGEARGDNGELHVRTDLRVGRGNIVQAGLYGG